MASNPIHKARDAPIWREPIITGYYQAMTRTLPSLVLGLLLVATIATGVDARPIRKAPAKRAAATVPERLAGWPPKGRVQLGDGSLRSEVVVSAHRLVGMKGSFDEQSFIRHILYVNDLARKDTFPAENWASALARRLVAKGLVRTSPTKARRGDLVLFGLKSGSRQVDQNRILFGVIDAVSGSRAHFVAPVGGTVRRGSTALVRGSGSKSDTALLCVNTKKKGKRGKGGTCRAGQVILGTVDIHALDQAW